MSQKTLMPMHAFSSVWPTRFLRDFFREVAFFLGACAIGFTFVGIVSMATARAPLSAPMPDLDLKRELLAGSDALLERMVIPPNRPDWVLMNCSDAAVSNGPQTAAATSSKETAYDRMRHTLCETARKQTVASFNF